MKEKVTREENTIGRFTNWLDTLARRAKYEYIENESKHISHACIDEVPEDALRADEIEISYTVSAGEVRDMSPLQMYFCSSRIRFSAK